MGSLSRLDIEQKALVGHRCLAAVKNKAKAIETKKELGRLANLYILQYQFYNI